MHGRQRAGVAFEENLLGGGEGIIFVDGGEHALDIGDIGGIGGDRDGVGAVGAAGAGPPIRKGRCVSPKAR